MKKQNLIPVSKAAEEFGVTRQTISNWQDAGILPVTFVKGNRFVSRSSLEKLKGLYPEAAADANKIDDYKQKVLSLQTELEEQIESLRKERIYRHYSPKFMNSFVEKFVKLMEVMTDDSYKVLADAKLIHCWLFGNDINETCKELGISYNRYLSSAKGYNNTLRELGDYIKMAEENRKMKAELEEMKKQLQNLQIDMDDYRARFDRVDEEQSLKEEYPILNKRIVELDFTVRTMNILKIHNFETLGQVIRYNKLQLLKLRNFGRKSLIEIEDFLEQYGLELGTDPTAPPIP